MEVQKKYRSTEKSIDLQKIQKKERGDVNTFLQRWKFIFTFSLDDFRTKYSGSILGLVWAFIQPVITILIYWFVFQIGFKSQPVENVPYIVWLVSGIVIWMFISETISSTVPVLIEYSYLVKKVVFDIKTLPWIRLVSNLYVHIFLMAVSVIFFLFFGVKPSVFYLQIFYYFAYALLLIAVIDYITVTLYVFYRDTSQIVGVIMQLLFWMTPIVWNIAAMPEVVCEILEFNPLYYIVRGYRDSLIGSTCFINYGWMNVYYWAVAVVLFCIGSRLFNKSKIHFADVL